MSPAHNPSTPPLQTNELSPSPRSGKGLVLKCHNPQLFVVEMSGCKLLEKNERGMKRWVTFREGMGPPVGKTEDDIVCYEPLK
ncbi:MAG: hypothetical protein M1830_001096, partial [Pleopsidium flavum]